MAECRSGRRTGRGLRYLVAKGDDGGIARGSADVPDGEQGVWKEDGLGSVCSVWRGVC